MSFSKKCSFATPELINVKVSPYFNDRKVFLLFLCVNVISVNFSPCASGWAGAIIGLSPCNTIGLDYVSCSPYRVPIARLAAAQAYLKKKSH